MNVISLIAEFQGYLKKRSTAEDLIDEEVHRFKEQRQKQKEEDDDDEIQEVIKRAHVKHPKDEVTLDSDDDINGHDSDENAASSSSRGKGRGRGSRGGRGSRRARGESSSARGSRGGRGSRSKAPVIDDSQRSISDSFAVSSKGKGKASASKKSNIM